MDEEKMKGIDVKFIPIINRQKKYWNIKESKPVKEYVNDLKINPEWQFEIRNNLRDRLDGAIQIKMFDNRFPDTVYVNEFSIIDFMTPQKAYTAITQWAFDVSHNESIVREIIRRLDEQRILR